MNGRISTLALVLALSASALPQIKVERARTIQGVRPLSMAAQPRGPLVAMGLENLSVRLFNPNNYQTVHDFTGHPQPPVSVTWGSLGVNVVSGDDSARTFVWDIQKRTRKGLYYGDHKRGVENVSINSDNTLAVSTGADDLIAVWRIPEPKRVAGLQGTGAVATAATFHPLRNELLVGELTGSRVIVYTVAGNTLKPLRSARAHDGQGVVFAAWSPDGSRIVTCGKNAIATVWDAKTLKPIANLRGHEDWVWRAAFTPNGKYLATSSPDRTIRIWDMKTFRAVKTIQEQKSVGSPIAFTSDGKFLLTAGVDDFLQVHKVTPAQGVVAPAPAKKPTPPRRGRRG